MVNQRAKDRLLDYALGALSAEERAEVERRLGEPDWRRELDRIKQQLQPLADYCEDIEPPLDLAGRTCSLVDSHIQAQRVCPNTVGLTAAMQPGSSAAGQGRAAEFIVAAGVFLALGLLFFPAVSNSRQLARRTQCSNNLRQLGLAMAVYSEQDSGGYFPCIPPSGKRAFAGIFGPTLYDSRYLVDSSLLICPSSRLAENRNEFEIPSLDRVDAATERELIGIRRRAGGSYGYNLGYVDGGVLRSSRNFRRAYFAIMADAPSLSLAGYQSSNHNGLGQNLLFEDGSIRYMVGPPSDDHADHPFRNHFGVVEAGVNDYDAVIATSFVPPFRFLSR